MLCTSLKTRSLEMRHVDPGRRRARRYHLAESPSLFGELGLVITWGRIGQRGRVRFESFSNASAFEARWLQLLTRRTAHGYRVHPLNVEHGALDGGEHDPEPSADPWTRTLLVSPTPSALATSLRTDTAGAPCSP